MHPPLPLMCMRTAPTYAMTAHGLEPVPTSLLQFPRRVGMSGHHRAHLEHVQMLGDPLYNDMRFGPKSLFMSALSPSVFSVASRRLYIRILGKEIEPIGHRLWRSVTSFLATPREQYTKGSDE